MPLSDIHKRKRSKNFMILAAIAAWIVLIWIVTMVKIANG
jgi:predicted nucleic acid-binding Zn ribbon protein